jgi:hypothetical protein
METELTTVWVSRYAGPVFSAERELQKRPFDGKFYVKHKYVCLVVGRDCFLTEAEALTDKKARLARQIKNLKKQAVKLTTQLEAMS